MMEITQDHDVPTNSKKEDKMIRRQTSSAVTAGTLSISGSDSSNSIAISALINEEVATNESTDVYLSKEFVHRVNEAARQENDKLNLNLGLPIDPSVIARRQPIKTIIQLVHRLLLLVESPLFRLWSQYLPLRLRQKLVLLAWKLYFPVHKLLIGRGTGIHRDASLEYHALTTVMWWGRMVNPLHICDELFYYASCIQ